MTTTPNTSVNLSFSPQAVVVILKALSKLPLEESMALYQGIEGEATRQIQAEIQAAANAHLFAEAPAAPAEAEAEDAA